MFFKRFLIFFFGGIVIFIMKIVLSTLTASAIKKAKEKQTLFSAFLANIVEFFSLKFLVFAYSFWLPFIMYILHFYKISAWIAVAIYFVSTIYAVFATFSDIKMFGNELALNNGYYWLSSIVIILLGVSGVRVTCTTIINVAYDTEVLAIPINLILYIAIALTAAFGVGMLIHLMITKDNYY